MPNLAKLRAHTDAFIAALETALADTIAVVGDAQKPAGAGWQGTPGQSEFTPHAIVYPWSGFIFDGSIAEPDDDAALEWQVTCVGRTRQQCESLVDNVFELIGTRIAVTGRSTERVRLGSAGGGVREDESVSPKVWVATPQLALWSTPA